MRTCMRFVVPQLAAAVLAAVSLHVRAAHATDCPPRVHANPALNEVCGREHYDSAATAQRCAYSDAVARMSADERDECGIGEKRGATQPAPGDVHVRPYERHDGTDVHGYYRTTPDGDPFDNYTFPGNVNPRTGRVATGNPDTYLRDYYGGRGVVVAARPEPPRSAGECGRSRVEQVAHHARAA
jgi:hypothetical protein